MGWTLRIYTPTGGPHVSGSLIAEYTESSPGGIVGGFRWSRAPHGDCLQMEFAAVPKLVDIPPRSIVHFLVDGQSAFYGFVARGGAPSSGRAEQYVVLGAARLLSQRYAYHAVSSPTDIGAIVRAILSQYAHPAIRYDPSRVPDTGYTLTRFSAPWVDIATILKDLSGAASGVTWGVDADGYIYFRPVSSLQAVRYEEADLQSLPVLAEEVWDRVRIIIPIKPNGVLRKVQYPLGGISYADPDPDQYAMVYTVDLAAGTRQVDLAPSVPSSVGAIMSPIGAERTIILGTTPPLRRMSYGGWLAGTPLGFSNAGNAIDGDESTYAVSTNPFGGGDLYLYVDGYPHTFGDTQPYEVRASWRIASGYEAAITPTLTAYSDPHEIIISGARSQFKAGGGAYYVRLKFSTGGAVYNVDDLVRVYDLSVYGVDATAIDRLAASVARAPYQEPTEVAVPGYLPPATTLTITGTPSGDVSGPVAEWEYEYSVERGLWTTARIGNKATDPQASAIRILASAITDDQTTRLRASMGG